MSKNQMTKMEREARKLCTHTIVFTDSESKLIATRAMQGRTTKAIAKELGISETTAQYRITKAQDSLGLKFRAEARSGKGKLATKMMKATERIAMKVVEQRIAPQFIPFARQGVSRLA